VTRVLYNYGDTLDPAVGAYSALPGLVGLRRPTSKGDGRGERREQGEEMGKGRD